MISLISIWKLKNGCPQPLADILQTLADKVGRSEPNTLMYVVNVQGPNPLNDALQPIVPPPPAIPDADQTQVVFIEHYANAEAFHDHVRGTVFNEFRTSTLQYFHEDPKNPGWPVMETTFLTPQSSLVR